MGRQTIIIQKEKNLRFLIFYYSKLSHRKPRQYSVFLNIGKKENIPIFWIQKVWKSQSLPTSVNRSAESSFTNIRMNTADTYILSNNNKNVKNLHVLLKWQQSCVNVFQVLEVRKNCENSTSKFTVHRVCTIHLKEGKRRLSKGEDRKE